MREQPVIMLLVVTYILKKKKLNAMEYFAVKYTGKRKYDRKHNDVVEVGR